MGGIIGGVIGGVGSLIGGGQAKSAANTGAQQSLAGYNYLKGNAANQGAQSTGLTAGQAQQGTQGQESSLLTSGQANNPAFSNYLNSTGYGFQQQQGNQAITTSAASRGLLGSGGTGKALAQYGQGLAGNYFNNYLGQLGQVNQQQQGTVNAGLTATGQVGQAGSSGGAAAGNLTAQGGAAMGNATTAASGAFGNMLGGVL